MEGRLANAMAEANEKVATWLRVPYYEKGFGGPILIEWYKWDAGRNQWYTVSAPSAAAQADLQSIPEPLHVSSSFWSLISALFGAALGNGILHH